MAKYTEEDQKKERQLYDRWRKTGDKSYFQSLYKSMKPLIYDAGKKASFGSNIPESAHRINAAQNFLNALKTYDPSKGTALQTHVYGTVHQKAKRLNYLYQNLGHMPEPRAQSVGLYQNVHANLRAELNREPSAAELGDRMGWSLTQVTSLQKELQKDLALSGGTEEKAYFESNRDEELLQYLYFDLSNEEKVVFDYIYGKHGKPSMIKRNGRVNYDGIARNVGVSTSKVRGLAASIGRQLEKVLKG